MVDFSRNAVVEYEWATPVLVQINQATEFQWLYSRLANSLLFHEQKDVKNRSDNAELSI